MATILENINTRLAALYEAAAAAVAGGANSYSIDGQAVTFNSTAEMYDEIARLEKARALYEGDWDCDSVAI